MSTHIAANVQSNLYCKFPFFTVNCTSWLVNWIKFQHGHLSLSSILWSHPRGNGTDFVWGLCLLDGWKVQITTACSQDNWRSRDGAPQLLASHQIHQGLPLTAPAWRYEVHLALVFILSYHAEQCLRAFYTVLNTGLCNTVWTLCFALLYSTQAPMSDCKRRMQSSVSSVSRWGTQMCMSH